MIDSPFQFRRQSAPRAFSNGGYGQGRGGVTCPPTQDYHTQAQTEFLNDSDDLAAFL
jgi:hypothetical protein